MTKTGAFQSPAGQARRIFVQQVEAALPAISAYLLAGARAQWPVDAPLVPGLQRDYRARLLAANLPAWVQAVVHELRVGLAFGWLGQETPDQALPGQVHTGGQEAEGGADGLAFRLAVAARARAGGQFDDLQVRVTRLEQKDELEPRDFLKPEVIAGIAVQAWVSAELSLETWQDLQPSVQEAFGFHLEQAYHAANAWLIDHGVMPEISLRRLCSDALASPVRAQALESGASVPGAWAGGGDASPAPGAARGNPTAAARGADTTVTQLLSTYGAEPSAADHAPALQAPSATPPRPVRGALQRLSALAGGYPVGEPGETAFQATVMESGLSLQDFVTVSGGPVAAARSAPSQEPYRQDQRQAAATQDERTTIEIVALLFYSILAEERLPSAVRVWFARLQMPVLRVAVTEPEFFATPDHPARRLIDRMGACVMGFGRKGPAVHEALELEIKRIVQVVEAYPDSGRRVFQTVLGEFEKFLDTYFREQNEMSRRAVSLAQQLEHRETLAIQYTIEFRRMLEGVPVQDGVRQFLFDVWADALATVSVSQGASSDRARALKRVAGDLIWSAGAKVTREDRADVLRRLPALLKAIREGMSTAGIPADRQEDLIKKLNNSLTEGFTAKAAPLPQRKLQDLMEQLESLEEMMPEGQHIEIDESFVRDIPGASDTELEVVVDGGGEPITAMLSWARELPVGSWYMLKHGAAERPVQLVWQGPRKELALFVTADAQCKLFQLRRLAAYLQSGLMQPAQDDDLSIKGIRGALDFLNPLPDSP
ncbi:MAG: DUF1631 family protein [Betaproteobacteria bacterium]